MTSARARTARHDEVARKEAYEARPRSHARPGAHGGRHINERSGGVGHGRAVGRVGNYTRAVVGDNAVNDRPQQGVGKGGEERRQK